MRTLVPESHDVVPEAAVSVHVPEDATYRSQYVKPLGHVLVSGSLKRVATESGMDSVPPVN